MDRKSVEDIKNSPLIEELGNRINALVAYIDGLDKPTRTNFNAVVEMGTDKIKDLLKQAIASGNKLGIEFTEQALLFRTLRDAMPKKEPSDPFPKKKKRK